MKTPIILATGLLLTASPLTLGATVAYWNFNSLNIGSASSPGTGDVPSSILADTGSGTLDLSAWTGTVDDFAGSTNNTQNSDPAGASLSLIAGTGLGGNGGTITIGISMSSLSNPVLSFATQGTGTGFTSNQLAWSINATDFTDFSSPYSPPASFDLQSFDLSAVDSLDGASNVWLRLTFDDASGSSGNNRIDNIAITAIPEPTSTALLGLAALTALMKRRR